MTQRAPLVVILGATACGKSRLAIELAQKFSGEIISADSMQVYKGLDIVTNKVTEDEQQQARHHIINFLDPMSRFSVIDFRNRSLEVITSLHEQKKLPIIVGGTNYYIESLLWKAFTLEPAFEKPITPQHVEISDTQQDESTDQGDSRDALTLIDSEAEHLNSLPETTRHTDEDLEDVDKFFSKRIYNDGFANIDGDRLWKILESVDKDMAHIYHPHDKRRIIRILQIIQQNKRKKNFTDILKEANVSDDTKKTSLGGPLRFSETCVIWLHCDNEILDKKMDERVDLMLNKGLLAELEEFHNSYNKRRLQEGKWSEYNKGIFQTIGFKEFHEYLLLDDVAKDSEEGNETLEKSIEQMKLSTRRYARRQMKWIRRRFLQSGSSRDLPPLFKLTTTFDEQAWKLNVYDPAVKIVENFLSGTEFDEELLVYKQQPTGFDMKNKPGKLNCEVCDRTFIGTNFIDAHLKSRNHLRNLMRQTIESKRQKLSNTPEFTESEGYACCDQTQEAATLASTIDAESNDPH